MKFLIILIQSNLFSFLNDVLLNFWQIITDEYKVTALPTIVLVKEEKIVDNVVGMNSQALEYRIKKYTIDAPETGA